MYYKWLRNLLLVSNRPLRKWEAQEAPFYEWYKRYQEHGFDGLKSRNKSPQQVWNTIPEWKRQRVVQVAKEYPEKSCREIACYITDTMEYFI